ncbi:MAG: Gfo/Idh/MocA family oxidoreductase [Candidatus Acidiferrales bacterium]
MAHESHKEIWETAAQSARPPRPKQALPIIIIGAGGIVSAAHLPAYAKAGFPVLALMDVAAGKAAELAKRSGVPDSFTTVEDAVDFAPSNAVYDVAVPASEILGVLSQLPDGVPVLMQKPMGETLAEATTIRDLCRRKSLIAAVNFQLRYAPFNLAARALFARGLLGEWHDFEAQVRTYTPWHLWSFLAAAPRLEILYHSIHYLDLIRSWFGNPRGIYAKTVRHPTYPSLAATKSVMILDYGDSKRVFVATNHGHDYGEEQQRSFVLWEGTEGSMRATLGVNLDYPAGKPDSLAYIHRSEMENGWQSCPVSGNWFPDAFVGSMGALQAYVEGSISELPSHFEDAYQTMALVEAAYASSAREAEPIPRDGD